MWIRILLGLRLYVVGWSLMLIFIDYDLAQAAENHSHDVERIWVITGIVQYEDLRRVPQAKVQLRDQEGLLLDTQVTNDGGEFIFGAPDSGIYSIRAIQSSLSSESAIVKISTEPNPWGQVTCSWVATE